MKRWTMLILLAVLGTAPAAAHPLDPALLELRQAADGRVEVLWQVPSALPQGAPLAPVLPESCRQVEPVTLHRGGPHTSARFAVDCGEASLVGTRLGVEGLRERETDALLRLHLADGRLIQAVLRGDEPFFTVPEREGRGEVFAGYLRMGFEHILGGLDHLVFVLGLLLLVRGRRRLFWTITAFTAGHSVTLSLAALGVVQVPSAPVEVLIAASILVVALELTRTWEGRPPASSWRSPQALAFGFGLLHGLGFAGALAEVGLPSGEIPVALFSFNCGIELGQLLFVGVLLVVGYALGRVALPRFVTRLPAYAVGGLASLWIFERASSLF